MFGLGVREANGALEIIDLPDPREPREGELLLDMVAAGVGPWDALLHTGGWDVELAFPGALGVEGAGRIAAIGPGESTFEVGDLVLIHEAPLPGGSGTWAEKTLVRATSAAPVPNGLAPAVAAALPIAGLTAEQSLDDLQVTEGTRLLVVGASGPTASLAVQLAKRRGAEVVAGAGLAHAERLGALGASDVIDTHVDGWAKDAERRFDAVLIAADGTSQDALDLVVDGGRLTSITLDAPESVRDIVSADLYVQPDGEALRRLAELLASGDLVFEVHSTPIREGIDVANRVGEGRSGGIKHVLEIR